MAFFADEIQKAAAPVGMWESRRSRFPSAVGKGGNRSLVFHVFHGAAFP
jgi:hypothetical protein